MELKWSRPFKKHLRLLSHMSRTCVDSINKGTGNKEVESVMSVWDVHDQNFRLRKIFQFQIEFI